MTTGPLAQTNSMELVLNTEFHLPKWLTGACNAIGTWLVVIGGIKSIARLAEKLVTNAHMCSLLRYQTLQDEDNPAKRDTDACQPAGRCLFQQPLRFEKLILMLY